MLRGVPSKVSPPSCPSPSYSVFLTELAAPDDSLAGIVIDDEATDELAYMLDRARRLKMETARPEAADSEAAARKVSVCTFSILSELTHHKFAKGTK